MGISGSGVGVVATWSSAWLDKAGGGTFSGGLLSFRPAVPNKAHNAAAIQKRTTILFSGQPWNWK